MPLIALLLVLFFFLLFHRGYSNNFYTGTVQPLTLLYMYIILVALL